MRCTSLEHLCSSKSVARGLLVVDLFLHLELEKMGVVMEPGLWGTLPKELLCLVFARLPVSGISQLRLLSKDWKKEVETSNSYFTRMLEETGYPRMFGLICWKDELYLDGICGRVFDVKSERWHGIPVDGAGYDEVTPVGAADGGLVCFVSQFTQDSMFIIVMNPLTGKRVRLPCLLGMGDVRPAVQPSMVQLLMDGEKQHYKVFAAGYVDSGDRHPFAQVYDSRTKKWTVVGSGQQSWDRIHGINYNWEDQHNYYMDICEGPCVYDFAEGRLHDFGWRSCNGEGPFEVVKNRVFVGHRQARAGPANLDVPDNDSGLPPKFYILEYQLQGNEWVKVETHDCPFDGKCSEKVCDGRGHMHNLRIYGCNRYLLALPDQSIRMPSSFEIDVKWLYDLFTREWRKLPKLWDHVYDGPGAVDSMCELRWDAVP